MTMNKKALIIEDDPDIANLIMLSLSDFGINSRVEADGLRALDIARTPGIDIILLDVMLPNLDGFSLCKKIRQDNLSTPILFLSSRSEEIDRVLGLEIGADDYVTKPFSTMELCARVKALLRRSEQLTLQKDINQQYSYLNLTINISSREVILDQMPVELTPKEFDLLTFFVKHPGQVFTRNELLNNVWGYSYEGYQHTVNTLINRLRSKIEINPQKPDYILTVRGIGYKLGCFNDLNGK